MSMLENPTPFEKWMFQNAEGVETYPKDKMLEKAFNDGKKIGEDKISKHILELQADKGRLTDENKQAKELIRELLKTQPLIENVYDIGKFDIDDYGDAIAKAEAFLNKE